MKKILKNSGISPAVGVILLIGITAAVATLAGVVLLDIGDGLTQTAQAGVEVNETTNGVEVTWNTDSNAEKIIVQANGQEYQLNSVNDSLTLGLTEGSTVSIIGVVDGEESVISETTTESDTGEGTVKNYSPGETSTVSGKVSVNPDIENATVRSVKNDTVISTTTTDSSGSYSLEAPENSRLEVIVEGFTYDSDKTFYGSTVQDLGSDLNSDVDIKFTEPESTVSVNGSEVLVANESYDGMKTIGSVEQLQAMKDDLSGEYILLRDIDASGTSSWNSGKGFDPIGDSSNTFTGSLDGNGHTISDLYVNRTGKTQVGLFSTLGDGSSVTELNLTGDITGSDTVGGIAGASEAKITETSFEGSVAGSGTVGGLLGTTSGGKVEDSYVRGSVTNNGSQETGGIIGYSGVKILNSYSTGNITDTGEGSTGGLVGYNNAEIILNSYATGDVTNSKGTTGGLIGYNAKGFEEELELSNTYATGNVTNNGAEATGGLIGYNNGLSISKSYATGDVTNSKGTTGGLIGYNNKSIFSENLELSNTYATGDVTNNGSGGTGGLVGVNSKGTVQTSYTSGSQSGDTVGGLVGFNSGTVQTSYTSGSVSGDTVGGLVGKNGEDADEYGSGEDGTVEDVYWDKDVSVSYAIGIEGGDDATDIIDGSTNSGGSSITNGVVSGLTTSEMTGENAVSNMSVFNFDSVWTTTDEYPELQE